MLVVLVVLNFNHVSSSSSLTLPHFQVQCNSCQNSVTFCSGCGGRLALFVPGSTTGTSAAEAVSTSPDDATVVKSEAAVSSSAETTNGSPKTEEKPRWVIFRALYLSLLMR